MSVWIVVLLLLLASLFLIHRVFWSRVYDRETRWLDPYLAFSPEAPDWREANRRAEALLAEFLTAEQLQALKTTGYLAIPSPGHPGRIYHIPRRSGQVMVYENGRRVLQLCVQPREHLPVADRILLHKLLIEGDEERYLDTANQMFVSDQ